jgi:hypothetical protein
MHTNRVPAFLVSLLAFFLPITLLGQQTNSCQNKRMLWADVVALDQPYMVNRLGASMPEGMVYALKRDVVSKTCAPNTICGDPLKSGNVMLRPGKRPRPITLRANVDDCITITFTNLLAAAPTNFQQPATRNASLHIAGMEVVGSIMSDGSFTASNPDSNVPQAAPGNTIKYILRATAEGTFLINSMGAAFGGKNQSNDGAQVTAGLFGAMNVQPKGSEWYRSQVTHEELEYAINTSLSGGFSALGQPFINYKAKFPAGHPNAGLPVLNMLDDKNNIVYTDLTAVITGPNAGKWPKQPAPPAGDPNLQPVNIEPNRLDPYREFTITYHELMNGVQAFPIFDDPDPNNPGQKNILAPTLGPGADQFAINYGTGGIGAEILANRFGLGPMGSCVDCRFEEFFLSAWTVGDPSMVVDVPANTPCSNQPNQPAVTAGVPPIGQPASAPCTIGIPGNAPYQNDPTKKVTPYRKATKTLYPDDPSNVYHSYINDRVKFRIIHTGTGVSHVHHLHAHQWVHSPNSEGSTYLDSQMINPGSAYTLEITFNGGGNRNKTVGDSIFHCHFYPHFAAGMWALWRTHDVYEVGSPFQTTKFDQLSRYKTRALPDGEIAAGTPIPGLIPMPTIMMPLMPGAVALQAVPNPNGGTSPVGYQAVADTSDPQRKNPGFPFFIPGVAGTRAPHPPLDFAVENGAILDGGLPRHILLNGRITEEQHSPLNFTKNYDKVNAYELPEDGTPVEKVAMDFHAQCFHPSFTPEGLASSATRAGYRTNGLPPKSGAPYADPGLVPRNENVQPTDNDPGFQCKPIDKWRRYKAAVIQTDLVQNKKGWHYPQARFLTLWEDVLKNIRSEVAQEPFFIRANTEEGVEYWHTNLVPDYYELDDYQVRTPTDIIGQHIHLVKFDVTSSDGAANGYNYEDGTLSYGEVAELVPHINDCGGLANSLATIGPCNPGNTPNRTKLTLKAPPASICPASEMNKAPCNEWMGAQTTVQRWYADPLDHENLNGTRTLRTVFTHDHFGPSTHQQTGLYAAFVVEPENSKWFQSETGAPLGTRDDGGPTSWNAVIETPDTGQYEKHEPNTYREFLLAMQDFQFAYTNASKLKVNPDQDIGWSNPQHVVEPPFGGGLGGSVGPQIVSAGPTSGVTSFNYRNEPLPWRVLPGAGDPKAADLAYVFNSNITRNDPALNVQPTPGASINPALGSTWIFPQKPLTFGMQPGDPYTPLLRAYEGDRVQIRVVAGAHMLPHAFTVGGMKWLFEPSWDDSGWRSSQSMGISEHFEFVFRTPRASGSPNPQANWTDYLYMPDASNQKHGLIDGTWGIFRAYKSTADTEKLLPLSTNKSVTPLPVATPQTARNFSCPPDAPDESIRVQARTPSSIIFNSRGVGPAGLYADATAPQFGTAIVNYFPMMYAREKYANSTEPLVIRVNAGDCLALTLVNAFSPTSGTFGNTTTAAFAPSIPLAPSRYAGLTPALMSFDAMTSTGLNVGFNPDQIVPIASAQDYANQKYSERTYYWYAGQTTVGQDGKVKGIPIELGGVNLTPADPLEQDLHGLVGGLIVEPKGVVVCADDALAAVPTFTSVTVYADGSCANPGKVLYREFVLVTQDNLATTEWNGGTTTIAGQTFTAPGGSTQTAVNYRTEPMAYRFAAATNTFVSNPNIYRGFWNGLVLAEPQTPIFTAAKGTPTRFRLLHPAGSGNQQVLALHGHVWQELPYQSASATAVSTSIANNVESQYLGARDNYGTNMSYEINLPSAGGKVPVTGDYLYRTTPSNFLQQGLWGVFRVSDSGSDAVRVAAAQFSSGNLWISGSTSVYVDSKGNSKNGNRASTVALYVGKTGQLGTLLSNKVPVGANGLWSYEQGPDQQVPGIGDNVPMQITAVSPNGGRSVLPLELVTGLPQPSAQVPTTEQQKGSDTNRFNAETRDHGEKFPQPQVQTPPVLPAPDPFIPPPPQP